MDGNKAIHRGQRGVWSHRCYASVLKYNIGPDWIVETWRDVYDREMGISTQRHFRFESVLFNLFTSLLLIICSIRECLELSSLFSIKVVLTIR